MFSVKKIFTTFLILSLVLSQLGYHFLYIYEQYKIKQEFKQSLFSSINEKELISFNACDKNIKWEEDNEFSVNGEMFDVVKSKQANNQTIYLCVNDTKENELIKKYVYGFSKNNSEKKSKIKFNFSFYNVNDIILNLSKKYAFDAEQKNTFYSQKLISTNSEIIIQPPKVSLV